VTVETFIDVPTVAYFKLLSSDSSEGTEENQEIPQLGYPVLLPILEFGTSRMHVNRGTA